MFGQSVIPVIHILHHFTLSLYRSLFSRFMLPEAILESDDMLTIDLNIRTLIS